MSKRARRGPGERAGISLDVVLTAARALFSEAGLEGVTMRRLAQRLGVAPNTLYSHFDDKTALFMAMTPPIPARETRGDDVAADPADASTSLRTAASPRETQTPPSAESAKPAGSVLRSISRPRTS